MTTLCFFNRSHSELPLKKTPCNLQGVFFRSVILRRVCDIGASESMYFAIVTSEFLTTGPSINLQKLSLPCVFEGECSQKHVFCSSRARVFHYSSVYKFRDLHFTTCFWWSLCRKHDFFQSRNPAEPGARARPKQPTLSIFMSEPLIGRTPQAYVALKCS